MQGERNNGPFDGEIEFRALSQSYAFDLYTSPGLPLTSHCLDPTVALACA